MNELYKMKLHDVLHDANTLSQIQRVPGGWTYTYFSENGTGGHDMSTCFVPFNNEFQGEQ